MRLQGGTLLESILALSLLASVVSFSMLLQSRIFSSSVSEDLINAWQLSEENIVLFRAAGELAEPPVDWSMEKKIVEEWNGIYRIELGYSRHGKLISNRVYYVNKE